MPGSFWLGFVLVFGVVVGLVFCVFGLDKVVWDVVVCCWWVGCGFAACVITSFWCLWGGCGCGLVLCAILVVLLAICLLVGYFGWSWYCWSLLDLNVCVIWVY